KRLTKHENTGLGWVIAASKSVCDTPIKDIALPHVRRTGLIGGLAAACDCFRGTVRTNVVQVHFSISVSTIP
ncbi:hypothetical protein, partial [Escherichia coli]|uniref:hypothetical protein n=1 Tax=Escherichia coli TaxID=562 RepID=UPI001A7E0FA8